MSERKLMVTRVVSVIAATVIALACGTNYAYSAWGPQFAERMKFSSTQSNIIGTFGNLGMYGGGIFVGMLVDAKGPRPGVILGGGLMGSGYFAIYRAYQRGPGSIALPWLCLFAFFTGIGGASAFSGSIKTSALNWPSHRGTATAFPLSAFGLGAFFFAFISNVAFPDDTSSFLLLLSLGTLFMCLAATPAIHLVPQSRLYAPVSNNEERRSSNPLQRTKSKEDRSHHDHHQEPDETSSLISQSSSSSPGDVMYENNRAETTAHHSSHHPDIRGVAMLKHTEFYQLFVLLGILTGVGIMTINNIGNDARALWSHYDDSASAVFIQERQMQHVMLLSVFSCIGRLCSGIGSDLIVKKLHASRHWCIFLSAMIFCVAQICGATIGNPHLLGFVSGINGLAYGFLFGVYPSLVAQTFGINGLSQNWGSMTLAPIVFGNIFNLLYGRIYDHHSYVHEGHRTCLEGLECYRRAYWVTLGGSFVALGLSLWSIRYAHVKQAWARKAERHDGGDA